MGVAALNQPYKGWPEARLRRETPVNGPEAYATIFHVVCLVQNAVALRVLTTHHPSVPHSPLFPLISPTLHHSISPPPSPVPSPWSLLPL